MAEYKSVDPVSREIKQSYESLLTEIKRNINPDSNTVLLIDDERGIRRKVARDVRQCAPNVVIVEASNGKEGL